MGRMKLYAILTLACLAIPCFSQSVPPIRLKAANGNPSVLQPTTIIVTNGTLSCTGKICTLATGGAGIGSTVSGGTTGSVLFVGASSALAQNNANFFWDDTSKRLGIGTASPAQQIHVLSTTSTETRALLENSQGASARLAIKSNTREWWVSVGGNGTTQNATFTIYDATGGGSIYPFFIQSGHRIGVNIDPFNTLGATFAIKPAGTSEPTLLVKDDNLGGSGSELLNLAKTVTGALNNVVNNTVIMDGTVFGGNGAAGFGLGIVTRLASTTTNSRDASLRSTFWTTATDASRSAAYAVQLVDNAAALAEKWRIAGNGANTGVNETLTGSNGATMVTGTISENLTLNTASTTTDTTMDLPANSIILAVTTRVTTTITTAVSFSVGDNSPNTARFSASAGGMTAGSTRVGLDHMQGGVATNANGPVQTATAKVRITTNANPGAGAIRITIHFATFTAPTS